MIGGGRHKYERIRTRGVPFFILLGFEVGEEGEERIERRRKPGEESENANWFAV